MTTNFRNPGAREAAWGRHYAKRGAAVVVTKSDHRPYPSERLREWLTRYYALSVSAQLGERYDNAA